MASRIMHLSIAKLVDKKIDFSDKDSFYLGCLAPDLTWYGQGDYDKSHFLQTQEGLKGIDYVRYVEKHSKDCMLSDFQLGYFVHLLTDAVWLKSIQQVYVRSNPEKKSELYQLGYKDMFKYNPILIKHYGLEPVGNKPLDAQMDEINLGLFENLLEDLKKDFLVDYMDEVFHVYPKKAVLDFIDTVVNKSYESILNIRREQGLEDSVHYFVPVK